MAIIVGTGDFKYRIVEDWAKLPDGWSFKEVGAVGVDQKDNIYVFNRGEHPVMVFDRDGNFLRSWGEGQYPRAHGIHMGPDDSVYLTDDGGHFVRKCSLDGKLLMSWGEPGTGPGEFNIVHNICTDADGWVYVADRENHRVQVFDGNGKYETQWKNLNRPCGLYMPYGHQPICYIGEVGPAAAVSRDIPNLWPRVSIVDNQGNLLGRFGDTPAGTELGRFLAPH